MGSPRGTKLDRHLLIGVVVWVTSGLTLVFFSGPLLYWFTLFLMFPVGIGYALIGIGLLAVAATRAWLTRGAIPSLIALFAVPTFAAVIWLGAGSALAKAGDSLVFRLRFAWLHLQYEQIVSTVTQVNRSSAHETHDGIRYDIDAGPPVRLAFPRPGGILDNWEGVVYDPSDRVALGACPSNRCAQKTTS